MAVVASSPQRVSAALRAISFRSSLVSFFALALPPAEAAFLIPFSSSLLATSLLSAYACLASMQDSTSTIGAETVTFPLLIGETRVDNLAISQALPRQAGTGSDDLAGTNP